jgi:glycosyltransferase involved in cell wall biosynthesis
MKQLSGAKVAVVSRCAWTLYNFRRTLIKNIEGRGAKVLALGGGGDGYDRRLIDEGITFADLPVSRQGINPLADLWLTLVMIARFRRERPQLLHAFTIKPVIYGTLAAVIARIPVRIVTITGLGHAFTTSSAPVRFLAQALYKLSLRFADVVFFQNRDDRDLFLSLRLLNRDKVRLTAGSGVDLVRFTPVELPSQRSGQVTFVMIARLIKEKGVLEYLAAAEKLKLHMPQVRCLLVGGVDLRNPSALLPAQLEHLKHSSCVEWVDEVVDVRPYIAQADVVVLPSYREGVPRSLLEGAAMGRALLTTDVPGCREVVTERSGLIVARADADALAEAMLKLANSAPMIALMGANARQFVVEHFDEVKVIRQYLEAYSEFLQSKAER